ncbi:MULTISPECIES: hypothetical protein [unclassified Shimia]|uniref:hypothetical protein n=1 Tax=unclassified Shimia TaxID=2630038 RepID=UPI001ADADE22|nr:hypothetical protein [Shimia sp. R9_2]MBO9398614.1 hypothetical protein [Shimia sp. R9_2]
MSLRRRAFLVGAAGLAGAVLVPLTLGGTTSFLRRTLKDHFGPEVLELAGIDDFVDEFAALAGEDDPAKKIAAEMYFGWHGDRVKMIGPAKAMQERFLFTILHRSNIIAVQQGRATEFEYGSVDPWSPVCGLYLSAFADETL